MLRTMKDIWYAITSPENYRDFMNYSKRHFLAYVFVLVFAAGIVTLGIPAAQFMARGGFGTLIEETIPEFSASADKGFWIEEPIEIDEYNFLIRADSSVVKEDITDLDGEYGSYDYVAVVDKEQFYFSLGGIQEVAARFDELPEFSLTKADLLVYVPVLYMAAVWTFVLSLLMDFGYYLMFALVVSMLSRVIASLMRIRIGKKALFRMAIYAQTLSYLLMIVQTVMGSYVPNFTFFSYVITLGYMFFAIKDYKERGIEELPPEKFGGREDKI